MNLASYTTARRFGRTNDACTGIAHPGYTLTAWVRGEHTANKDEGTRVSKPRNNETCSQREGIGLEETDRVVPGPELSRRRLGGRRYLREPLEGVRAGLIATLARQMRRYFVRGLATSNEWVGCLTPCPWRIFCPTRAPHSLTFFPSLVSLLVAFFKSRTVWSKDEKTRTIILAIGPSQPAT